MAPRADPGAPLLSACLLRCFAAQCETESLAEAKTTLEETRARWTAEKSCLEEAQKKWQPEKEALEATLVCCADHSASCLMTRWCL